MKKLFTLFITAILATSLFGEKLVLIETNSIEETKKVFSNKNIIVHFYCDDLIIATQLKEDETKHTALTSNAWKEDHLYYLLWAEENGIQQYKADIKDYADILYTGSNFLIVEVETDHARFLKPAVHGGLVHLKRMKASLPKPQDQTYREITYNPMIADMINQVDADLIRDNVQHLEDYGTRDCFEPESVEAQNWIKEQFESYGLETSLQSFEVWGTDVSDNVIATIEGQTQPEEYVIIGAHYDSYSWSGEAPGADDNASGTSGVMETARILSQYEFDKSVVFCAWSGEEYGLYGSDAYATNAASQGMNILGYFNMDMIGYLHEGHDIHTNIIAPSSAQELVDFYISTIAVYLPDFEATQAQLSGGNSDHTSFNNNGYMGIFPFEDVNYYSPYIHTDEDIVGLSFNSKEMARTFTQAALSAVATKAGVLGYVGTDESLATGVDYSLYPNPGNGKVFFHTAGNITGITIEILDITGKTITSIEHIELSEIDLSNQPDGVYFARIIYPGFVKTEKIIIQ